MVIASAMRPFYFKRTARFLWLLGMLVWHPFLGLAACIPNPLDPPAPVIKITALNRVAKSDLNAVLLQTLRMAQGLYELGERNGKESIFPIDPRQFVQIYRDDFQTGFSHIALRENGAVAGFALANFDEQSQAVHLEKLGVDSSLQAQGISRKMLHALASRTVDLKIPFVELLVRKGNAHAISVYERYGMRNVSPPETLSNPRYNAFLYRGLAVELDRLTQ